MSEKKKKQQKEHYVNNKEFNLAIVEYAKTVSEATSNDQDVPVVTEYIGSCFLKIAEGLSRRPNFIQYTFREEMVSDAVENCLKAVLNFDPTKQTRSGTPNAFAYFTQISWYAFLRRIAKEKKHQDIKNMLIQEGDPDEFADFNEDVSADAIVQRIRNRNSDYMNDAFSIKSLGKKTYNKVFKGGTLNDFLK